MNKNRIRLTESQLHKAIKESVYKVLNEISCGGTSKQGNPYDNWDGGFGDNWSDEQWSEYEKKRAEKYKDMPNRDYFNESKGFANNEQSKMMDWKKKRTDVFYDKDGKPISKKYIPRDKDGIPMPKKVTESQLHNIVKESINKVLQEGWFGNVFDTVFNGGKKQEQERQQFLLNRKIGFIETLLSKGDFNKAREIASELIRNGQASEEDWDEWVTCNYQTKEERNMFKPRKKSLQQQLDLRNSLSTQQRSTPQQKQQQSTQHQFDNDKATGKYYRDRNEGWALARDGHIYWTKDLNSEDAIRYAQKFGGNGTFNR